jgi:hypothetical protein
MGGATGAEALRWFRRGIGIHRMKAGKKLSVAFRRASIRRMSTGAAKPPHPAPAKVPYLRLVVSNSALRKR